MDNFLYTRYSFDCTVLSNMYPQDCIDLCSKHNEFLHLTCTHCILIQGYSGYSACTSVGQTAILGQQYLQNGKME